MSADKPVIPIHQWTHDGKEVMIVKCVPKDGITQGSRDSRMRKKFGASYKFQWPLTIGVSVVADDWIADAQCGGGLHGWPWGLSIGDGKEPDWTGSTWIVFGSDPKEVLDLGGKVKARSGIIRYIGDWQGATNFVLSGQIAYVTQASSGAASATGWSGAASATGWRGAASATGERGAASATGWSGAASATGWSGAASATGGRGIASSTGEYSTVECGSSGLAVSTADQVAWIARPGAILVHRWTGKTQNPPVKPGCKRATFNRLRAVDGERITFLCGKIISREKPENPK